MKNTTIRMRTGLAVAALAALPLPLGIAQAPAVALEAAPVSKHHVYVAEITNKGTPPSVATVKAAVDRALARWEVESDGKLSMERVGGVATFETATDCKNSGPIYDEARALPEFDGVDWRDAAHNHLVVVTVGDCRQNSGGSNPVKFSFDRGGNVLYSYSDKDAQSLFHELGHNFGLFHASAQVKENGAWVTSEYGDKYSPMGTVVTTEPAYTHASLDSFERTVLGIADSQEVPKLTLPEGQRVRSFQVDLRGRGTDTGVRGAEVVDPRDGTTYFLDFRSGAVRDKDSYYGSKSLTTNSEWNRGVTVQKVLRDKVYYGVPRTLSEIQPLTGAGGETRYALTAGRSYRSDTDGDNQEIGFRVDVESMQLTGSADDVARLRVTLTDERVPFGVQTGSIGITGRGGVGDLMTAGVGSWTPGSSLSQITWLDNGAVIPGAVGATYRIPAELQGHRLSARVAGEQESYLPLTVESSEVLVGDGLQGFLDEGAVFEIRSASTGLLLTDPGSSQLTAKAATSGSTAAQQWRVDSVQADGSFRLVNLASAKCIDNAGSGTEIGNPTIRYACHGYANQRWTILGSGTGYALVNLRSQLSVAPASAADGALVAQSSGSYAWQFTKVG